MKMIICLALFCSFAVFAESELSCWNLYAQKGSPPILKAKIKDQTTLWDLKFNFKDLWFSNYFIDTTEDSGERWNHEPAKTLSKLEPPAGNFTPVLITSKRSPYEGDNEYVFQLGTYSFTSPYYNTEGKYVARLILPTDLSAEFLKNYRIRIASERSNAVMIIPPGYDTHQGGSNYLRMFCQSR
jgi:hypothetical protein